MENLCVKVNFLTQIFRLSPFPYWNESSEISKYTFINILDSVSKSV